MDKERLVDLILRAQHRDEQAIETLMREFRPKVTAIAREYFLMGADFDDLLQESMIGLYKAINIYDGSKNNNFGAFASMCIHRQLQNAVKLANRKKNEPLNSYRPINLYDGSSTSENDKILNLVIVDDNSDIEENFLAQETNKIMMSKVKDILSDEQFRLLKMFLNGDSYSEMSQKMNMTSKQIDNNLQVIKRKLRTIKGDMQ